MFMLEKHANWTLLSHEHMFYQAKMCGTNQIPWVIQVNAYLLFRWNLLQAQCKFCASCAAHSPTWPQTKQSWITVTSKCGLHWLCNSVVSLQVNCQHNAEASCCAGLNWILCKAPDLNGLPVWVKGSAQIQLNSTATSDGITQHSYFRWLCYHKKWQLQISFCSWARFYLQCCAA